MTLTIPKFRFLFSLPCAVMLVACAPMTVPPKAEYPVGRSRLVLPAGAWQDLGATDVALPLLPGPGTTVPLQTRAVGLRGSQGEWLAVLRVQTNRSVDLTRPVVWSGYCPQQKDVMGDDAAASSPVRADCLRFKRWASSAQWLDKNHPEMVTWLDGRQITLKQPYSYFSYRYATEGGALVQLDGLADHRLLRPKTQNNEEFLTAGPPAQTWGENLAQAARLSVGMVDGFLTIPPFPFPAPVSTP
ncbi:MAG: hypothetical protein KKB08_09070 [Gammaproteobacteria bacterium]|nr:hypothetical protein [Gammaproteobacteria bacterium]